MWQILISLAIVAAAAGYLIRTLRRRWTGQDSGCAFCPHRGGCSPRPDTAPKSACNSTAPTAPTPRDRP